MREKRKKDMRTTEDTESTEEEEAEGNAMFSETSVYYVPSVVENSSSEKIC